MRQRVRSESVGRYQFLLTVMKLVHGTLKMQDRKMTDKIAGVVLHFPPLLLVRHFCISAPAISGPAFVDGQRHSEVTSFVIIQQAGGARNKIKHGQRPCL